MHSVHLEPCGVVAAFLHFINPGLCFNPLGAQLGQCLNTIECSEAGVSSNLHTSSSSSKPAGQPGWCLALISNSEIQYPYVAFPGNATFSGLQGCRQQHHNGCRLGR